MQSVLGDKKPNCLIIDEIDGLEGRESNAAIDLLVKLITGIKGGEGDESEKSNCSYRFASSSQWGERGEGGGRK
jgi:hypothetical protein